MKNLKTFPVGIALLCFSVFFISCSKKESTGVGAVTAVSFLAGAENIYSWSGSTENDSGAITYAEQDTIITKVISTNEQVYGFSNVILLEGTSVVYNGVSRTWYVSNFDSLVEIAYSGAGRIPIILPKPAKELFYSDFIFPVSLKKYFLNKNFKALMDSMIMRDDFRTVYKFPLNSRKKWTSFRSPFLQNREVIGNEVVTVPAGAFFCAKIRTSIDMASDSSLLWYDYVSDAGLIKRTFEFHAEITTVNNPDGVGEYVTMRENLELISRK